MANVSRLYNRSAEKVYFEGFEEVKIGEWTVYGSKENLHDMDEKIGTDKVKETLNGDLFVVIQTGNAKADLYLKWGRYFVQSVYEPAEKNPRRIPLTRPILRAE